MAEGARYRYVQEIHRQEGYWGIWAPDVHLQLGDVGFFKGLEFERQTSLENLGVSFSIHSDPTFGDRKYATSGSVNFSFKGTGETNAELFPNVPSAKAGIRLDFTRENSIVYAFVNCRQDVIDDIPEVARQIASSDKGWEERWVIITQVVHAGSGTVVVSETKGSFLEVSADADVGADFVALARVDIGLTRRSGSMFAHETMAREGMTPLYKAGQVVKKTGGIEPLDGAILAEADGLSIVDTGPDLTSA